ncbi:MAG: PhnD/SsuA/transferrin family substrate-binding protein [Thermodesulfobacteriota bacterium]
MKRLFAVLLAFCFVVAGGCGMSLAADDVNCWFPPDWKDKGAQAKAISEVLTEKSGLTVRPRIAKSYPEILQAFSGSDASLVYVGSFVQAIIKARGLGTTLAQQVNGQEFYSGVLIYPQGQDPAAIISNSPAAIAYAVGASSGESCAKAATGGKAAIATPNHGASVGAVKSGKAKAAMVKNWWWDANKDKYPEMAMYEIPDISLVKNPDNVLTASRAIPAEQADKIRQAALSGGEVFGKGEMKAFDSSSLDFSLSLMKKGGIDPLTYSW